MNVSINQDGCIGCELCVQTCPEVFQMGENGLAEVYNSPTKELIDKVNEAAENCPVEVIIIEN